ncbi:unnamed protein product [Schistosoma curassoni]|uniref:Uncharacterized protein n=1 Tax=Schistosoma curassoni TaxID=6186 RepID=A0A183JN90_9TREM|nr:unnamed protein product [Schistosoma curassoni]
MKTFTYLNSIVNEQGGYDADLKARIGKVRQTFLQLKNIWNLKQLSVSQHQCQDLQYECQDSSIVRSSILKNYHNHHREGMHKKSSMQSNIEQQESKQETVIDSSNCDLSSPTTTITCLTESIQSSNESDKI